MKKGISEPFFNTKSLLLTICGAVMILAQFIAVREIGSTFFSTEIIAVLTTLAIMLGPCLAYAIAHLVTDFFLRIWFFLTFATLILLPTGVRLLVALMNRAGLEWLAMVLVLLAITLCSSAFFAIFLPRYAQTSNDFRKFYLCELIGAVSALVLVALIGNRWVVLLTVFWSLIVVVIHLAFRRIPITLATGITVVHASLFYPAMDHFAARQYYSGYWGMQQPKVLEVVYSPYQRIEIVRSRTGLSIHLDGVPYFRSGGLHWFNIYMSRIPGRLAPNKGKALVIGSGSMSTTGFLKEEGFDVTTVEIDAEVPKLGLRYFSGISKLKPNNLHLVIDDARSYIRTVPDATFDLIVMDVPAPYRLQTALLYTPTFFTQLKRCLKPGGIASICSCSYNLKNAVAGAIAAGTIQIFGDVTAVKSERVGLTILYCSDRLPFSSKQLLAALAEDEKKKRVYDLPAIQRVIQNIKPHSRDNLCALLMLARWEFPEIEW